MLTVVSKMANDVSSVEDVTQVAQSVRSCTQLKGGIDRKVLVSMQFTEHVFFNYGMLLYLDLNPMLIDIGRYPLQIIF